MGLLGLYPQKSTSTINDQWERSGTRKYIAAFTTGCDENYVRSNLGASLIINYPHPTDAGQVVQSISVDQGEELSEFFDPTPITGPTNSANGTPCFWWGIDIAYGPW